MLTVTLMVRDAEWVHRCILPTTPHAQLPKLKSLSLHGISTNLSPSRLPILAQLDFWIETRGFVEDLSRICFLYLKYPLHLHLHKVSLDWKRPELTRTGDDDEAYRRRKSQPRFVVSLTSVGRAAFVGHARSWTNTETP